MARGLSCFQKEGTTNRKTIGWHVVVFGNISWRCRYGCCSSCVPVSVGIDVFEGNAQVFCSFINFTASSSKMARFCPNSVCWWSTRLQVWPSKSWWDLEYELSPSNRTDGGFTFRFFECNMIYPLRIKTIYLIFILIYSRLSNWWCPPKNYQSWSCTRIMFQ